MAHEQRVVPERPQLAGRPANVQNVGIYTGAWFNLASGDGSEYVSGANVSWTMFRTLGVAPTLGRDFDDDDRVGAPKVVLLSDRIWHERFGARADVLGQEILINGIRHRVIGVLPAGFEFPNAAGAWMTMQLDPMNNRGNHS